MNSSEGRAEAQRIQTLRDGLELSLRIIAATMGYSISSREGRDYAEELLTQIPEDDLLVIYKLERRGSSVLFPPGDSPKPRAVAKLIIARLRKGNITG